MSTFRIAVTARTGRHGLKVRLARLGFKLADNELEKIYELYLKIADQRRFVLDEELAAIVLQRNKKDNNEYS